MRNSKLLIFFFFFLSVSCNKYLAYDMQSNNNGYRMDGLPLATLWGGVHIQCVKDSAIGNLDEK